MGADAWALPHLSPAPLTLAQGRGPIQGLYLADSRGTSVG